MENSFTQNMDYESSSDEIFFGKVGDKENEIMKRRKKRITSLFTESFREHPSFSPSVSIDSIGDNETEELSSFMEDSLNFNVLEKPLENETGNLPLLTHSANWVENSLNVDEMAEKLQEWGDVEDNQTTLPFFLEDSLNLVEGPGKSGLSFEVDNEIDILDVNEGKILRVDEIQYESMKLELSPTGEELEMLDKNENCVLNFYENKLNENDHSESDICISPCEKIDTVVTPKCEISHLLYQDSGILNTFKEPECVTESLALSKLSLGSPQKLCEGANLETELQQIKLEKDFSSAPFKTLEEDCLRESQSSPEADFFFLDESENDGIIDNLSCESPQPNPYKYPMDELDLSRETLSSISNKKSYKDHEITSTPAKSLASLNCHTSVHLEEMLKENHIPQECPDVKHRVYDELNKLQKKATHVKWSPQTDSHPVRSYIPVLTGSCGKLLNRGACSAKKGFKKWDIVSPVAQYIRERPLPPLFKTVKPLRDLPISKTTNDITPIKKRSSPTISKLPPAEYESSCQKKMQTAINTSPGNGPKIIRHIGRSKAIQDASYLLSDKSLLLQNNDGKAFGKKLSAFGVNESIIEVAQLQRTNTLVSPNKK